MTLVVGLGNPLREDEGIGVRIVQELERSLGARCADVRFLDIGTSGMRLLDALPGFDRAIIVDCARMGQAPGTMLRFTEGDVETRRESASITPHMGDLLHIVALARRLGTCPDDVVFFGIEPVALDYVAELSLLLEEGLPLYLRRIVEEIDRPQA